MKRILSILLLTAPLLPAETLEELLQIAETNNPSIAAARLQWDASRERSVLAGALPDPRISYGYYLEEVQTKTGPQQQKAGLSQRFPLFGKRGLAERAAEHAAEAQYARLRAVRANTLFDLKQSWFESFYLTRAVATTRARARLFETLEKTAERTVENGGDARDLLDLQITRTRIEDRLKTLESKQPALLAKINALLNRDAAHPLHFPDTLPPVHSLRETNTKTAFFSNSPALEEQRAQLAQKQARETLARRNGMPDITLGADWIQTGDGGDDPLITGISINLPIWGSKNRAEKLSSELETAAQEQFLLDRINRLQAQLTRLFLERNDAARRETFYTGKLIPPAEQHFDLTRIAYQNGEANLQELTASEERLLDLRLACERAKTDRAVVDAEIERILGGPAP